MNLTQEMLDLYRHFVGMQKSLSPVHGAFARPQAGPDLGFSPGSEAQTTSSNHFRLARFGGLTCAVYGFSR